MPTKGHSTVVQYGNASTYATSTVWTRVGTRVSDVKGAEVQADDIDISHMESPEQYDEFTAGWANGGEPTLNLQFIKAEYQFIKDTLFRADKGFRMVLFDGSGLGWDGYIKGFGLEVERKGIVTVPVTFKVSGKPTYFAAS